MGCGGLGASVAVSFFEQGHTVYVLDLSEEAFVRLPRGAIIDRQIVPIVGNGTVRQDLSRASLQDAGVFVALTGMDTRNALASQMAKHLYRVPTVICRIDDPAMQNMYNNLGIIAISATILATDLVIKASGAYS